MSDIKIEKCTRLMEYLYSIASEYDGKINWSKIRTMNPYQIKSSKYFDMFKCTKRQKKVQTKLVDYKDSDDQQDFLNYVICKYQHEITSYDIHFKYVYEMVGGKESYFIFNEVDEDKKLPVTTWINKEGFNVFKVNKNDTDESVHHTYIIIIENNKVYVMDTNGKIGIDNSTQEIIRKYFKTFDFIDFITLSGMIGMQHFINDNIGLCFPTSTFLLVCIFYLRDKYGPIDTWNFNLIDCIQRAFNHDELYFERNNIILYLIYAVVRAIKNQYKEKLESGSPLQLKNLLKPMIRTSSSKKTRLTQKLQYDSNVIEPDYTFVSPFPQKRMNKRLRIVSSPDHVSPNTRSKKKVNIDPDDLGDVSDVSDVSESILDD